MGSTFHSFVSCLPSWFCSEVFPVRSRIKNIGKADLMALYTHPMGITYAQHNSLLFPAKRDCCDENRMFLRATTVHNNVNYKNSLMYESSKHLDVSTCSGTCTEAPVV